MKKIGIIGGLGPEATVDYYKRITGFFHERNQGLSTPEIIIYSTDISELFGFVESQRWSALADWLVAKLAALKGAGADFAAISANTPHIVFDQVLENSPLPLISIVEATLASAKSMGLKNIGLLGTKFTMQSNFFGSRFAEEGISVVVPSIDEQAFIHDRLINEIELGIFSNETRKGLVSVIDNMARRDQVEAVILGCTELPLILAQSDSRLPLLNTTEIHVSAICEHCLQVF